ncbi:hypothetical protein LZC95_14995 [Pendulispora brunnea]|uniref:Uncharacterized protein n=1 Tax=Pendulispora brunnea TaxID=2905690 RepID=A0ABZ2KKJ0_9BACT
MKHAPSLRMALGGVAVGAAATLAIATGCSKDSEAAPANKTVEKAPVEQVAAGNHIEGKNFKLDATPEGDCKAGATCVLVLRLEAAGGYHVNKEYPYKFKAADLAGIEFQGTDAAGKNVFSKNAGDFKIDGEKTATLRVKFKPSAKGNVTISGNYKMSVCSEKDCQIEAQDISASVPVK